MPKMTAGARFRRDFLKAYEVDDPGGLALLTQAVAALDRIAELEALVASDGPQAIGSTGQAVGHWAMDQIRKERDSFTRLLRDLEPPPEPTKGSSQAGKDLVRKRWSP